MTWEGNRQTFLSSSFKRQNPISSAVRSSASTTTSTLGMPVCRETNTGQVRAEEPSPQVFTSQLHVPTQTEGQILSNVPVLMQLCQKGMYCILQCGDSHGGLFKIKKHSFPSLGAALWLHRCLKNSQDWAQRCHHW